MNIAENLKSFMESKKIDGITAIQIAKELNISKKTLSNYVNGDAYIPLKHLNALSNLFDISIDYILGLTKTQNYPKMKKIKYLDPKIIGKNILQFRKNLKLTQEEFANKIDTNKSVVSRYEKGTNLILTINLFLIATNFNISADYLLGKIDKPKQLNL